MIAAIAMCMTFVDVSSVSAASSPTLNKSYVKMFLGSSTTLKVKNAPSKAKITYKSSNKSIVTVNSKGKLTAKKSGKAVINVTVKKGSSTTKLTANVSVKKPVVAVLDGGASKSVKVKKALTVTDAGPRGKKGNHADNQIKRIKKEAPKADIISIRITDSDDLIYTGVMADAVYLAIENKADIIYYSCYGDSAGEGEYAALKKAIAAGIKIVGPAGNDYGKDARKMNWMTNKKGMTIVGAYDKKTKKILKRSNKHANIYIIAPSTSAAAARYAGMLAAGKVYDDYKK